MSSPKGGSRLGTRFGPYELKSLIGVGGMGEVYRAWDTAKERTVAIKLLRPDMAADPAFQERFRRESRVAARLQEPHVIPVHDFGDIDGVLYIDMRLVEGASLKELIRTAGPLPATRAVSIIAQVAAALDAAHSNGLVHRDIKPENVLLTHDDFAYIVDFGIAHGGGEANVTKTGLVIGSCAYMAPERISGERGGPASDIYSLTCLLYECLTGRAPYDSGDLREIMGAHLFSPPPRPSIMRRGISRAFDEVIERGMAKKPTDRYTTAGELAKAAAAAAEHPPVAMPIQPPPPAPSTRQFSAVDPNPASTRYQPMYAPQPPPPTNRKRFGPTQVGLVAATVVLFTAAVVLALVLAFGNNGGGSAPQTPLAVPPSTTTQTTAPSATTTTTPSTTTTTTTTPTTSGPPIAGVSGTDSQGFIGHTTRCESGSTPVAAIRTAQSLAVICETGAGTYQYRGERLRDGANVQLNNARPVGGGFVATNPADGARYDVQPGLLTISSNGKVDSAEPALEYGSAAR